MKKISWKPRRSNQSVRASVGILRLGCIFHPAKKFKPDNWYASVWVYGHFTDSVRCGSNRTSLLEAKEDAVRLARELLFDYQAAIDVEMKNFED